MPLKASIGLSKKVGLPDYGSLGASCHLELELDTSTIEDAETFHEKIRKLYALANQAVVDQLARSNGNGHPANGNGKSNGRAAESGNGNGEQNGNGELASNKQIKFLLDLGRQQHDMDLARIAQFCQDQVGVSDVYQLTKSQASTVIDRLNGKNGNGKATANGRMRR